MNSNEIEIAAEDPHSADAVLLMDELSKCLEAITGNSGKGSFSVEDVCTGRSLFVIARDQNGNAIGCGAFRPFDEKTAEIKRMYVRAKSNGIGTEILSFLEQQAYNIGYTSLCLETRTINKRAVSFYQNNGYYVIPNYGKYINHAEAICFGKNLLTP